MGGTLFRTAKPFHPQRLWDFLPTALIEIGVVRSKGFLWLASRPDTQALWSQAGPSGRCDPVGVPVAASGIWPEDPDERAEIGRRWHPRYGDRQHRRRRAVTGDHAGAGGMTPPAGSGADPVRSNLPAPGEGALIVAACLRGAMARQRRTAANARSGWAGHGGRSGSRLSKTITNTVIVALEVVMASSNRSERPAPAGLMAACTGKRSLALARPSTSTEAEPLISALRAAMRQSHAGILIRSGGCLGQCAYAPLVAVGTASQRTGARPVVALGPVRSRADIGTLCDRIRSDDPRSTPTAMQHLVLRRTDPNDT